MCEINSKSDKLHYYMCICVRNFMYNCILQQFWKTVTLQLIRESANIQNSINKFSNCNSIPMNQTTM